MGRTGASLLTPAAEHRASNHDGNGGPRPALTLYRPPSAGARPLPDATNVSVLRPALRGFAARFALATPPLLA